MVVVVVVGACAEEDLQKYVFKFLNIIFYYYRFLYKIEWSCTASFSFI